MVAWAPSRHVSKPGPASAQLQQQLDADPSLLLAAIPILVPHLGPADRLALWRTCRDAALAVWQAHPPGTLALHGRRSPLSWAALVKSSGSGATAADLAGRIQAAVPRFLQPALATTPPSRTLQLLDMRVSERDLRLLPLHPLHHLCLTRCHVVPEPPAPHPPPQPQRLRLRALTHIDSTPTLRTLLTMVDASALTAFTTDDPELFPLLRPPQPPARPVAPLPALRRLRLTMPDGKVTDTQLSLLLTCLPVLDELWLPDLELGQDHGQAHCRWGELRVQGGSLDALALAALPLRNIARVVVEREIKAWGYARALTWAQAWPRLRSARGRFEFEPGFTGWSYLWSWAQSRACQVDLGLDDDEPGFTLHMPPFSAPAPQATLFAHLVAERLRHGTFVYSDTGCDLSQLAVAAAPVMAGLAPSVTSVVLRNCYGVVHDPRVLFAHLPAHVQRLAIKRPNAGSWAINPKFLRTVYFRG